jgi:AbiV family abortive infection protein
MAASPRIAFHLGTLALEETGKASLLAISATSAALGREEPSIVTTALDDHVRKLFWALWGPSIQSERVTVEQIESLRGMARHIHETRLRGLYVDVSADGVIAPETAVAPADAELLVGMAAARLDLEPDHQLPTDPNRRDLQLWFIRATEDPERRNLIMGKRSLDRLAELRSPSAWIQWLKQQFDEADARSKELSTRPAPAQASTASLIARELAVMRTRSPCCFHARYSALNRGVENASRASVEPLVEVVAARGRRMRPHLLEGDNHNACSRQSRESPNGMLASGAGLKGRGCRCVDYASSFGRQCPKSVVVRHSLGRLNCPAPRMRPLSAAVAGRPIRSTCDKRPLLERECRFNQQVLVAAAYFDVSIERVPLAGFNQLFDSHTRARRWRQGTPGPSTDVSSARIARYRE